MDPSALPPVGGFSVLRGKERLAALGVRNEPCGWTSPSTGVHRPGSPGTDTRTLTGSRGQIGRSPALDLLSVSSEVVVPPGSPDGHSTSAESDLAASQGRTIANPRQLRPGRSQRGDPADSQ